MTRESMPSLSVRVYAVALALLAYLAAARDATALDDDQQAALRIATTNIESAAADVESARGSAGTADNPAKGSRLKLTQMRLDQAIGRLNAAAEALTPLPADDAEVKAAKEQHAEVAAVVTEIEAILAGGSKPATSNEEQPAAADNDAPAMAPAPDAPKLHYKQEEQLKNARFYLKEVDRNGAAVAAIVQRLDGEGEPVVHGDVQEALNTLKVADDKYALAAKYLEGLPADHPEVKPVAENAAEAHDALGALRSRLEAADARLGKLTDMGNYPDFDADYEKMGEFTGRYGNFQMTQQQPEKLAEIIAEDAQVLAEMQRIAKAYLPLVEQKTPQGEQMENRFGYFVEQRTAFVNEALAYKEQLPGLIDADIAEAVGLAEQGVNEQKPMYFGPDSGIAQRLGWAEPKVAVLAAFDAEAAKPYQAKLAETRGQIDKMAASLSQQIIDANQPPPDRFEGADRDEVIQIAIDGWKEQQPDAEVIKAYIPSRAWERETKWEWFADAFHKVDRSSLQVQLIVKHNDGLAVIRPMNLRKNHLEGDTIIAVPFYGIDDKLQPSAYLRMEKVNQ